MRVFILARASKNNPKQLKYLLIVDGQTEAAYFKAIFQRFKISAKTIKRVPPSGGNAVSFGLSEVRTFETTDRRSYERYYIIIDRDNLTRSEYQQIQCEINQNEYTRLVFSNVAIEVWLLAYYQQMTSRPVHSSADNDRNIRELSRHLGEAYQKGNSIQIDKIINSAEHPIDTAHNHTSSIRELCFDRQCTHVGIFLQELINGL